MFESIFKTFGNCFKIPELKSRIGFTFLLLAICRLAAHIRVPGLDGVALSAYLTNSANTAGGGLMNMYSMFTGGALENCAVGALGIMPYISATIVIQLLTAVVPTLSKLSREEGGRVKIIKYSRYLTVLICMGQGFWMAMNWEKPNGIFSGWDMNHPLVLVNNLWWYRIQTVLILTTGTLLLMWLGEQITERGIGNGISLVITIGILGRFPAAVTSMFDMFHSTAQVEAPLNWGHAIILLALLIGVVAGCIAVTQAQRKIPVQYAQRAVGRKMFSGGTSFLPLRLNFAGVMPIIFAGAVLMVPQKLFELIGARFPTMHYFVKIAAALNDGAVYLILFSLMILFFSYFWTATQFNELQIADDLKKNGGYIPGVRPGQATSDYLHNSMSRITLAGAVFLTIIAIIPIILVRNLHIPQVASNFFGSTSMLILVGVLLDTMRQIESHLLMRHYDGFLKGSKGGGSKLRGRI